MANGVRTHDEGILHRSPEASLQYGTDTRNLLIYCLPTVGMGFMFIMISIYLLKFSTDVLLIAPGTMGVLFGLSRIWDAVSDPLVGYWTDRTQSSMGRRRPWMLAGALPMGVSFLMLWSPPASLEGTPLVAWMGVALIMFYTAMTMIDVPHSALGAELSDDYHERTRIFGWKRMLFGVGTLGAVAGIGAFDAFEDGRQVGRIMAGCAALLGVFVLLFAVGRLRERPDYRGRGSSNPYRALRDVVANPHARLLLGVWVIQQLGLTSLIVTLPFLSEYVLLTPEWTFVYIGAMFVATLAGIPAWMALAPRFEKKHVLMACMAGLGVVISLFTLAGEGDVIFVLALGVLGGLFAGGTDVIAPSIEADIIDFDEYKTGERKEGAYFATWAFAAKSAGGISAMIVGLSLDGLGFVPNAVQADDVKLGLRALTALLPAALYAAGALLFFRFELTRDEHTRIRLVLDQRTNDRR